jgi:hypothetical protein
MRRSWRILGSNDGYDAGRIRDAQVLVATLEQHALESRPVR